MFCFRMFCVALLVFAICPAYGQQSSKKMTNQDVIDMVGIGLSDEVLIDKIHSASATEFDTSIEALKTLKAAKVSDAVIRAMIQPAPSPAAAPSAPPSAVNNGLPEEVGVYVMLKGKMTEVEPEIVGWKTGGLMKAMATGGLTKGHVNGKIMKAKSPLQTISPVEFIIKAPEGTAVTEYQLLRLDMKGDRREFRAMTGGIIHASGGAEKNSVEFQPEKIANRTWRIKLTEIKKGEYGFLPPGISSASISSSGKIYSFGVIE